MSHYYYYDNSKRIGPVSIGRLKDLAQNGEITVDTQIEHENGKRIAARQFAGLYFPFQDINAETVISENDDVPTESQELLSKLIDYDKTFFPAPIREYEFQKDYPTLYRVIRHTRHYFVAIWLFFILVWIGASAAVFLRWGVFPSVCATILFGLLCKIAADGVIFAWKARIERLALAIRTEINTRK